MNISAEVRNRAGVHEVTVQTGAIRRSIAIGAKEQGQGSAVNGGELLFAALATCFCNDLYREARKRGLDIDGVEVTAQGEFGAEGEPGTNIQYSVVVDSRAPRESILELIHHTDSVAEIHNTLRQSSAVVLSGCEIRPLPPSAKQQQCNNPRAQRDGHE